MPTILYTPKFSHSCIAVTLTLLSLPLCAGKHPNAGDGLWGSGEEVPTFLYAMPLGGNRVFLEETALVAKPALPFAVLKRRLERRLEAMGVKVTKVRPFGWRACTCGGGMSSKVSLEETALVVEPALPFAVLKRRLERRLDAVGPKSPR